jgi:hypothetical protein
VVTIVVRDGLLAMRFDRTSKRWCCYSRNYLNTDMLFTNCKLNVYGLTQLSPPTFTMVSGLGTLGLSGRPMGRLVDFGFVDSDTKRGGRPRGRFTNWTASRCTLLRLPKGRPRPRFIGASNPAGVSAISRTRGQLIQLSLRKTPQEIVTHH